MLKHKHITTPLQYGGVCVCGHRYEQVYLESLSRMLHILTTLYTKSILLAYVMTNMESMTLFELVYYY